MGGVSRHPLPPNNGAPAYLPALSDRLPGYEALCGLVIGTGEISGDR